MPIRMFGIVGVMLFAAILRADPPREEPEVARAVLFEVKVYEVDHSQLPSDGDSKKVQAAFDELLKPWLDGWRGAKLDKGGVATWATKGAVAVSDVEKRNGAVRLVSERKLMVHDGEIGSFDYGGKTPQIEIQERDQGSSRTTPLASTFALETAVTDSGRVFVSLFFDRNGSPRKKRSTVEELKQKGVKVFSELSVGQTLCLSDARFNSNQSDDSLLATITPIEIKTLEEGQRICAVAAKPAKPKELEITVEDRWPLGDITVGQRVVAIPVTIEKTSLQADITGLTFSVYAQSSQRVTRIESLPNQTGRRVTVSVPFAQEHDGEPQVKAILENYVEGLRSVTSTFVVPAATVPQADLLNGRPIQDIYDHIPVELRPRPVELTVGESFTAIGVAGLLTQSQIEAHQELGPLSLNLVDKDMGGSWRATATKIGMTRLIQFAVGSDMIGPARLTEYLVKADTRELELHIRQQFPSAKVAITSIGASAVMLKGTVASDEDATGIVEIAEQFAPKVHNRLKVGVEMGSRTRESSDRSLTTSATKPAAVRQANGIAEASSSTGERGGVSPPVELNRAIDRGADATPLAESNVAEPQRVRPRKAVRDASSKSNELQQLRDDIRELRQEVRELIQRLDREQAAVPKNDSSEKSANAETHQQLIGTLVAKLLSRAAENSTTPTADNVGSEKKRICFIGVANGTDNEVGELKDEIYELIDTAISGSQSYQSISRRYVEAGLKQLRLHPDDISIKENQRNFQVIMEEMGQPFDELLVAKLTSGTTQQGKNNQPDYLLTLEMINTHNGASQKEAFKLRNARLVSEFNKLIRDFNERMDQQRFAEAEVIAKQAVDLDPNSPLSQTMTFKAAIARRIADNGKQWPATTAPEKTAPSTSEPLEPTHHAHESVIENAWQMLGLRLAPLAEFEKKQLLSKFQGGMKVTDVRPNSPASQNKIHKDDILIGLHVWEISNFENLQFALGHPHVVQQGALKFYVVRGTETLFGELKIVTPAMPMPSSIRIDPPRQPRSIALSDLPNQLVTELDKLKLHIEVHRALIDTALEARGITVTDDEARQFLQVHADRDQIPVAFFDAMKQTPLGQQFLQAARQQLALVKYSGQTTEPTEQELRDAFQLAQTGRVACRLLTFADKTKANEVARELHANPERFEEIAAKHGQPNSYSGRTLIPTIPPNPLDEVVAKLKDGEVSEVIQAGDQFTIYQRQQLYKPSGSFEQLKPQLRATLILNKSNEIAQREVEKLRKEYRLIVVPAGATSADTGPSKLNPAQIPLQNADWESPAQPGHGPAKLDPLAVQASQATSFPTSKGKLVGPSWEDIANRQRKFTPADDDAKLIIKTYSVAQLVVPAQPSRCRCSFEWTTTKPNWCDSASRFRP